MINLEPHYLMLTKNILSQHIPHKTVWVYGSRIKGSSHEGSDLDLVVMEPLTTSERTSLIEAFSDSALPILVDILDWKSLPESFKNEIMQAHEVLQEGAL